MKRPDRARTSTRTPGRRSPAAIDPGPGDVAKTLLKCHFQKEMDYRGGTGGGAGGDKISADKQPLESYQPC